MPMPITRRFTEEEIRNLGVEQFAIDYYLMKEQKQSVKYDDDDAQRRIHNSKVGKLAEILVSDHYGASKPDFKIYATGTKMYRGDLHCGPAVIHVKTGERSYEKWQPTWLVALDDLAKTSPIPEDLFVFCIADTGRDKSITITLHSDILAVDVTAEYWGEPKSEKLKTKKAALYWFGDIIPKFREHIRIAPLELNPGIKLQ